MHQNGHLIKSRIAIKLQFNNEFWCNKIPSRCKCQFHCICKSFWSVVTTVTALFNYCLSLSSWLHDDVSLTWISLESESLTSLWLLSTPIQFSLHSVASECAVTNVTGQFNAIFSKPFRRRLHWIIVDNDWNLNPSSILDVSRTQHRLT